MLVYTCIHTYYTGLQKKLFFLVQLCLYLPSIRTIAYSKSLLAVSIYQLQFTYYPHFIFLPSLTGKRQLRAKQIFFFLIISSWWIVLVSVDVVPTTLIHFVIFVVNIFWKISENRLQTLWFVCILLTSVLKFTTKIKRGCLTMPVEYALDTYVNGRREYESLWSLEYQWFAKNKIIISTTVTRVWSIYWASIKITVTNGNTPILLQQKYLFPIQKMFQYHFFSKQHQSLRRILLKTLVFLKMTLNIVEKHQIDKQFY